MASTATSHSFAAQSPNPGSTTGAVARGLGIGLVAVGLAVGGWFGFSAWRESHQSGSTAAPVATTNESEPATNIAEDPHDRARAQIAADRIAQPAGDNAAETYLAILAANPGDSGARQALIEILPMVNDVASAAADAGTVDELARLIGLMEQADGGYAQLPRLRQRQAELVRVAAQAAADLERREALALRQSPQPPVAAASVPAVAAQQAVAPANRDPLVPAAAPTTPAQATASAPSTPLAAAARPADAGRLSSAEPTPTLAAASIAAPPAARTQIVEPRLLSRVEPRYPPQALSRRLEGFVEVELTISASGQTTDVRVVRAEPNSPLFTREAQRVARDWRFAPKTVDGEPTQGTVRQRLNFRMPRG